jgi:plastocyanin
MEELRMRSSKMIVFGLLAAFLTLGLAACGGGEEAQKDEEDVVAEEAPQAQTKEVVLYDYRFNPNTLTVPVGTTIKFTNKDPDRHNVNIPQLNIDKALAAGETFEHTFDTTGEFAVGNRFRSGMKMTLNVE